MLRERVSGVRSVIRAGGGLRRAALGTLVVALLAAGCGSSRPSQLDSAAIVGGTGIPIKQVQGQIDMVLHKEGDQARAQLVAGHQLDDVSRQIVTLRIRSMLAELAAKRDHLSVSSVEVSKLLYQVGGAAAASQGTIWDEDGYRQHAHDQLLMEKLGHNALRTAVTVDYTSATTREGAVKRLKELAAAGEAGARNMIRADVKAGKDAVVGKRIVAGDDPIFATTPAFGVPRGTVVAFQIADTKPWLIMVVRDRAANATPSPQAPNPQDIDPAVFEAIGLRELSPLARAVGVQLNPRYGFWDAVNLQAVPNANETAGVAEPLRAAGRA
jgi:hypothetical protein